MAANIKLKRSAVAGRIPSADQLELGEVAINTADGKMYIKRDVNGTETVVLVNDAQEGIWKQYAYTATAGQTTFSGNDDNSQVLSYSIGYAEVYLNGILLDPAVDYTANTGYEIELTSPAALDDLIQIDSFASTIGPGDIVVNTFTGDNSTVSFTLTTDAGVEQNVSVFVDGVYQEKDTYSLSGTNLVFGEAPYTGASIEAVIGSRNITITEINDLTITGDFSAQGTISGNSFSGTSATLTGALASGSVTTGNIDSSGTIDADGDITTLTDVNANNVVATNDITATGDVEGASLTVTGSAGAMTWNSDEETLDIPLNSEVTLQAGQENLFRIKATEAIANGEVVMFAGAQGDHILGAKADQQSVGFSPEYVIGVATQDFSINEFGFVTTFGKVRGLNTSGYSEGDILYLNPTVAGALTTTKPTPPDHVHQIAAVLSSNPAEGTILVRPTHFSDTDEIPEGSTNLYYTDARANSAIDTRVTTAFLSNLLDAGDVDYDNAVSGISANTVQEAIDYLNTLSGGGNQGDVASYTRQTFVGTDGVSNTTFTITDGYTLGYLEVYLNGVLLNNSDYTANDESTVVLATAARDDDELITIAHDSFAIAELLRTTSISASAPDDAITLDADGNVLVGKTTTSNSSAGGVVYAGKVDLVRDDVGSFADFHVSGSQVGSIRAAAGTITVNGTDGTGVYFANSSIFPTGHAGKDLGTSTIRFNNVYSAGTLYAGENEFPTSTVGQSAGRHALVHNGSPRLILWDASAGAEGNQSHIMLGGKPTNSSTLLAGGSIRGGVEDAVGAKGFLAFDTMVNDGGGSTEKLRLTSAGNVGINRTAPEAPLHVYNPNGGNATDKASMLSEAVLKLQPHVQNSTNLLVAQVDDGNAVGLQVTNGPATANWDIALNPFGGNVGIGTVDPTVKLEIQENTNSADVKLRLRSFNSSSAGRSTYVAYNPDTRIMGFGETGTELNIDSSGTVAVGATPKAWSTINNKLQVGKSALTNYANNTVLGANWYYNSGDKYHSTGAATLYKQENGNHLWYNAPSGVQDTGFVPNEVMKIDTSGIISFSETTSPSFPARSINAYSNGYMYLTGGANGIVIKDSGDNGSRVQVNSTSIQLETNGNLRTNITAGGVQIRQKGNRLQEMSFQTAQSAFNNPTFTVVSNASYGGLHAQISAVLELHSHGLSANRAQYTKILVSCEVDSNNNLTNLITSTVSHTTIGTTPAVGTVGISGGTLYFIPNRQTNYDTYTLNTMVRSVNADFTIGA